MLTPSAVHSAPRDGRKVGDEFTVPQRGTHHRDNDRSGDEVAWWERHAIDPIATSRMLWVSTAESNECNKSGGERGHPASVGNFEAAEV